MTVDPRNVEQDGLQGGDNTESADATAVLRAYHARKRTISVRTTIFLVPLVAIASVRNPVAGLQLALGGVIGVLNMLATMRESERLLSGKRGRAVHVFNGQLRIFAVGIIPVVVAVRLGQAWAVGLYLAGFFTPLALYALAYRRSLQRGE